MIQLTVLDDSALSDAVLNQLVVMGAAYEGNGRWVVTNEDLLVLVHQTALRFRQFLVFQAFSMTSR
ncbi:hypothetical protein OH492_09240 [Vibrio chagasii]|nr:hypothetical protein [Vibrio chagasii]